MARTLSVLVHDRPGVLSRVSGLFTRRGFNIESLAVGKSEYEGLSRITIVVARSGNGGKVEQIVKQLNKLIDVIKVREMNEEDTLERELVLFKVNATGEARREVQEICENFRAKIVDVSLDTLVVEVTGDHEKILALEALLKHFGIQEVVRTGTIAMTRGMQKKKYLNKGEMNNGANVL